jgi:hypothetical protein
MGIFLLTGLGYLVLTNLFNGLGETKETFNIILIQVLAFLPAAPFAVKMLRVIGLITALIASNLLGIIYGLIQAWRKYRLKIGAISGLKIYSAAGISALTLAAASFNLPASFSMCVKGILYSLTYLTAVAFIGAVGKQDLANLTQILNKVRIVGFIAKPILSYEGHLINFRQRLLKYNHRR